MARFYIDSLYDVFFNSLPFIKDKIPVIENLDYSKPSKGDLIIDKTNKIVSIVY